MSRFFAGSDSDSESSSDDEQVQKAPVQAFTVSIPFLFLNIYVLGHCTKSVIFINLFCCCAL